MPKLKETAKKVGGFILLASAAVGALIVVLTPTDKDDAIFTKWSKGCDAYRNGQLAQQRDGISPTYPIVECGDTPTPPPADFQ